MPGWQCSLWRSDKTYGTTWLSPILFAVALTPAIPQNFSCERGDTFLLDLQFVLESQDLIQGFNINNRAYAVGTSGSTVTVSADARMGDSNVTYQRLVDGNSIGAGEIGLRGGTAVLNIPQGQRQLRVNVRAIEGVVDGYTVDVDQQEPPTRVVEQATKQVGSSLACSHLVLLPNESYSFELSPLVIDSDSNNQVSLSGQLRVAATGCSGFLIPPVRVESVDITVSVASASPTTLTPLVAGLPAQPHLPQLLVERRDRS